MSYQINNQQNTTLQVIQPAAEGDSLSTSNTLRTPVLQIDTARPTHLSMPRVARPPKVEYQSLSTEDSVFFNLTQKQEKEWFESEMSASQAMQLATFSDSAMQVADSLALVADSAHLKPAIVYEQAKVRNSNPIADSRDWLSGFLVLGLIIAGLVKMNASKYLNDLFSSVRYQQSASKLFSTLNLQNTKPSIALSFLFFLNTSLLVFELASLTNAAMLFSPIVAFLIILLGILGFILGKTITYRFIGFVFDTTTETKEYIFNSNLLSKAFGLLLLPIVVIVPFVDATTGMLLVKGGIVLFLVMYVIQLLRGVKIILKTPLSIFYMILYFCALEILPLSILIKVMIL